MSRLREPTNPLSLSSRFQRVVRDRCGTVQLGSLILAFPTVGQGPVINALSLPIFRHSFVGFPSRLKGCENVELHTPLFWNHLKNILFGMTRSLISLQHKQRGGLTWSINEIPHWLNTMTNILKHPLTSTFASNNVRLTAHVNSEVMFLFRYLFVTLTVLVDTVERMLVNDSEHGAF